ncbi:MAG: hypothetical protein AAGJ83_01360, partial [Planctomycetota bacterium]
ADPETVLRLLNAIHQVNSKTPRVTWNAKALVPIPYAVAAVVLACFLSVAATMAVIPSDATRASLEAEAERGAASSVPVQLAGFDRSRVVVMEDPEFTQRYSMIDYDPIARWQKRQ